MSAATLRVHHRLYRRYVDRSNALSAGAFPDALSAYLHAAYRPALADLRRQAAQAWLHERFFGDMTPTPRAPSLQLAQQIQRDFGELGELARHWSAAADSVFGSGWVHLVMQPGGRLLVQTSTDGWLPPWAPLLTMDVWEHAYDIDHPADRTGYAAAWLEQLADWQAASKRHARWC